MAGSAKVVAFGDHDRWVSDGLELGERERSSHSIMWDIGDWWNRGEPYGDRAQIVTAASWTGPKHQTCRDAAWVAKRWRASLRKDTLSFEHHKVAARIKDDNEAIALLEWCLDAPEPRSAEELRARIKQVRRADREVDLAEATVAASEALGSKLYGVIMADPPWRFAPYSRDTGMDRAADNHYPTMTIERIRAMAVPAADDAVLFLWATVPMLPEALSVMAAWGFTYKSHCVWAKDRVGTGYWFRNQHELLLVGTRGNVPAPAHGEQYASVISAPLGRHSAKPNAFAEMIEAMFPTLPALEMFARGPRLGWTVWGNQAEEAA
jgi:N6-adenosine-specific RNA methylase IME4